MVDRLGDDFDFRIITTDRDLGDKQVYANVQVDAWNAIGKARVFYTSSSTRSLLNFARLIRETPHDLLYLNSFFDSRFTLQTLLILWLRLAPRKPIVIAPRGEFSIGALSIKSWKKKPFLKIARLSGLFKDAYWHASTNMELADILRGFKIDTNRVSVVRNIAIAPDLLQEQENFIGVSTGVVNKTSDILRVCFLSRISPMKNLEFALNVLSQVNATIAFSIFGPREDSGYWEKCQLLIDNLPANVNVAYCGSVEHAAVKNTIEKHDIFFVPSLGENFGHVFMEALAAGVPILVSDQTPWRDLENLGIGWDIPLDQPEKFVNVIEAAAQFDMAQRTKMMRNCQKYAQDKTDDPMAIELNRALFIGPLTSVHH